MCFAVARRSWTTLPCWLCAIAELPRAARPTAFPACSKGLKPVTAEPFLRGRGLSSSPAGQHDKLTYSDCELSG